MRPVRLRMHSFAAFREPTTVDFDGVDYLVLVGPTGAGKSTVIDAMTFALYGTVPRWNDERTVRLALAPTAQRGTVSLVFDVGGERYVAARELRRTPSTDAVTVKEARLERFADPAATGEPGDETVVLADGAKVTAAVEGLLGLSFKDFRTSVVLPQGEFAEFLHARPAVRQEKLERILGLGVYDLIMKRANAEASGAQQRAAVLGEQLLAYADATADVERAARARLDACERLRTRVDGIAPRIRGAGDELARADVEAERARSELALLTALSPPDGLDELDTRRRRDAAALDRARSRADEADRADTEARARLDTAPDRAELEGLARGHAELAGLDADLPGLRVRFEDTRRAHADATAAATAARTAHDDARDGRDAASTALTVAEDEAADLARRHEALAAHAPPDGLDELASRRDAASAALDRAAAGLTTAERAEEDARAAVASAPPREPLEQARRDHAALAGAREASAAAGHRRDDAHRTEQRAAERSDAARAHRDHARAELDRAQRADHAAALRPALTAGAECPVCAQTVHVLPAPLPDDATAAARAAADAAETAYEREQGVHTEAAGELRAAVADADRAAAAVEDLEAAVAGHPDPDAVAAELARLGTLAEDAAAADTAVRAARRTRDDARRTADETDRETASVATRLRAARAPVVALGEALPAEDDDPVAGWRAFAAWAAGRADAVTTALAGARERAAVAERTRDTAAAALDEAARAADGGRRVETAAALAEQEAGTALTRDEARAAALRTELDGRPPAVDVAAELERLAVLERAARDADTAARAAREAVRVAERDRETTEHAVAAARDELRRLRDPLVALDAPAPAGDTLAQAWSALSAWAAEQAGVRRGALAAATAAADTARRTADELRAEVRTALVEHDVVPDAGTDDPGPAVAAAVQRARAGLERTVERRAEAADLVARRDEADETRQVARMLGDQLRGDRFPRWLVASALDALVEDGSRRLAELSDGQFALTHDKGEFLVVDHADADAHRPVRTLSGGETFQASLALALALSDQLAGLAARGAPRLESIFLDEGFGTLDESSLETVAGTLENLATRGDRMVGVITHVSALADRVPVRYTVRRDQRTSSIVRDGGDAA